MLMVTISDDGRIAIPAEIMEALGVGPGDKVMLGRNRLGELVIGRAPVRHELARPRPIEEVLAEAQVAFAGLAERLGVRNEDDVQELINEVRYGRTARNEAAPPKEARPPADDAD